MWTVRFGILEAREVFDATFEPVLDISEDVRNPQEHGEHLLEQRLVMVQHIDDERVDLFSVRGHKTIQNQLRFQKRVDVREQVVRTSDGLEQVADELRQSCDANHRLFLT